MSKYGSLRQGEGHSKYFLTRTLSEHDETMDHPLMKSIYDKSISKADLVLYLRGQLLLFRALEHLLGQSSPDSAFEAFFHVALHRAPALEADLRVHGTSSASSGEPSAATQAYLHQLQKDGQDPRLLLCHHFLQYNAVLSGGQYLKRMLNAKFGKAADNKEGVRFYCFDAIQASAHAKYVQAYCQRMDGLALSDSDQHDMLACMKTTYELTLSMMDEITPRGEKMAAVLLPAQVEPELVDITLETLHSFTGGGSGDRILLSLRGRVFDATNGSESYGPGGNYALFAGHDVTRCLSTMSLDAFDLDDMAYVPDSEEQWKGLLTWEHRLGAMYPVVGSIRGDERSALLPPAAVAAAAAQPLAPVPAGACPFTGKIAGECPLGAISLGRGGSGEGECPWPFVMLHDPKEGWTRHQTKNTAVIIGLAAVLAMQLARLVWDNL